MSLAADMSVCAVRPFTSGLDPTLPFRRSEPHPSTLQGCPSAAEIDAAADNLADLGRDYIAALGAVDYTMSCHCCHGQPTSCTSRDCWTFVNVCMPRHTIARYLCTITLSTSATATTAGVCVSESSAGGQVCATARATVRSPGEQAGLRAFGMRTAHASMRRLVQEARSRALTASAWRLRSAGRATQHAWRPSLRTCPS